MGKLNTSEVHERRHRRILDRRELESIIANVIHHEIDALHLGGTVVASDISLKFEDETEGSPSYKVGTRCIVDVVEKLSAPQASDGITTTRGR